MRPTGESSYRVYVGCIVCKLRTDKYKGLYEGFEIFSKSEERKKKNLTTSLPLLNRYRRYSTVVIKKNDGNEKKRKKKGRRITKDRKEKKR